MTKEQCGDGYQAEKNYQSPQGGYNHTSHV